jgi:Xaa-Pro aminopeptidase
MEMDYRRKLTGLQEKMEELDVDLVVYGSCQNYQYLTGLPVEWRRGVDLMYPEDNVYVPREGDPVVTMSAMASSHAGETWIEDVRPMERGADYRDMVAKLASDLG